MPYTSPLAPLAHPTTSMPPEANLTEPHVRSHSHSPPTHERAATFPTERSLSLSNLSHAPPSRPSLPRSSFSSQAYLRRHRRSPSYSKAALPAGGDKSNNQWSMSVDPHASLRQSPPPRNNAIIPTGAVISPPESAGNSSDEEVSPKMVIRRMDPIDAAIETLKAKKDIKKGHSLMRKEEENEDVAGAKHVPALTPEARKISHSRSTSTESSLAFVSDSTENSSTESEREESADSPKPPMVRKKSGELVRPALRTKRRPSSMPGTPLFAKNVHFDAQLEHIRHFLQVDKPLAVSANTSPVETYNEEHEYPFGKKEQATEWEVRLPNFPSNPSARKKHPVRLERIFLSPNHQNLVGVVSVANLAFHKNVVARFTVDYWKTVSEVTAEYNHDVRRKQAHDGYDRFDFNIKLSDITDLDKKTLFVCIRYSVSGREFWDNNDNMNYQIEFSKADKSRSRERDHHLPTSRDHGRALPRARNSLSGVARPRSMPPASFDDMRPSKSNIATLDGSGRHADPVFDLSATEPHDWLETPPKPREKRAPQAFSSRYDFGLSLSAAKSSGATEDRTTLAAKAKSLSSRGESLTNVHAQPMRSDSTSQVSAFSTSKPHLESPKYKELVDKYCFFGSTKKSDSPRPGGSQGSSNGANSGNGSPNNSEMPRADSGIAINMPSDSPKGSPYDSSPIIFTALYHGHMPRSHNRFLSDSQPPAIIG